MEKLGKALFLRLRSRRQSSSVETLIESQEMQVTPVESSILNPPSASEWTTIKYITAQGKEISVIVPFTADEVKALTQGEDANTRLIDYGVSSSGVEREYWITGGQFYPDRDIWNNRESTIKMLTESSNAANIQLTRVGVMGDIYHHPQSIADLKTVTKTLSAMHANLPQKQ